jgi:hypothetical protein
MASKDGYQARGEGSNWKRWVTRQREEEKRKFCWGTKKLVGCAAFASSQRRDAGDR